MDGDEEEEERSWRRKEGRLGGWEEGEERRLDLAIGRINWRLGGGVRFFIYCVYLRVGCLR